MVKIIIREALLSDSNELVALCGQLGYQTGESELVQRLSHILAEKSEKVFLAINSINQVLGWIHVFKATRLEVPVFAEIGGLVVDEEFRGKNIGKRLLNKAEDWAKSQSIGTMRIRSNMIRTEAHRFYLEQGYILEKQQQVFTKKLDEL